LYLAQQKHQQKKKIVELRKKDYAYLTKELGIYKYRKYFIRPRNEWVASTYNLDRQKISFYRWLFEKYPIPLHLIRGMLLQYDPTLKEIFMEWIISIGAGESFRKLVNGFMTNREAHLFLYANNCRKIAGAGCYS